MPPVRTTTPGLSKLLALEPLPLPPDGAVKDPGLDKYIRDLHNYLRRLFTKFGEIGAGFGADIPKGVIVWWTGTSANIPAGWVIADGTANAAPLGSGIDARKFIKGSTVAGTTGGAATHTHTSPTHDHNVSASPHTATQPHTHVIEEEFTEELGSDAFGGSPSGFYAVTVPPVNTSSETIIFPAIDVTEDGVAVTTDAGGAEPVHVTLIPIEKVV